MVSGQQQELFLLRTGQLESMVRDISSQLLTRPVEKALWAGMEELGNHHPEARKDDLRVTIMAYRGAICLGANPKFPVIGGQGHDIGKINIPLQILNKSYSLAHGEWVYEGSDSDMEIMMAHPEQGCEYWMNVAEGLKGQDKIDILAAAWIALTHHTEQTFKPYPSEFPQAPEILAQLSGLVPIVTQAQRIVSVVDQYGAAYRNNPKFHGALDHDRARAELEKNTNYPEGQEIIKALFNEETGIF